MIHPYLNGLEIKGKKMIEKYINSFIYLFYMETKERLYSLKKKKDKDIVVSRN